MITVPEYWDIIHHPMDLDTILKRIKAGWYDEDNTIVVESHIEVRKLDLIRLD